MEVPKQEDDEDLEDDLEEINRDVLLMKKLKKGKVCILLFFLNSQSMEVLLVK